MGVLTDPTLTAPPGRAATNLFSWLGAGPNTLLSVVEGQAVDRSAPDAADRVADAVRTVVLTLGDELPTGPLLPLWQTLAALGHADLTVARLAEGHIDAVRILHEAGRAPVPDAVYGVWASASGGTGLTASTTTGETGETGETGWTVNGTMRFCSGAWFIDRALTVVSTDEGKVLVDIDVRSRHLARLDDTWPSLGMDASRSVDIEVHDLPVPRDAAVGGPGFYLDRPGFTLGGAGVAAVWLGGAHGLLHSLLRNQTRAANPHQLAHLGAMAVAISSADALLTSLAGQPLSLADMTAARTAVELAVLEVLTRAPRVTGPNGLCRNGEIAHRLADLEIYVRQHHGEADYEQIGAHLVETGTLLGRTFR
ncbi:acyl-CoA dehydrogenase family protein [Kineosporia mesophila]|uniref:Acyl-CoA dehydrogenase family protein n=1 Tax=Kineosporia mesophila TaxID=566012 RepID=A0ABP6ZTK8_9ACTN|nr:acyl-CoA dehydrogenase family protein [Kineosporia mesophila]MCD5348652.1 acyl-CoA/acyl-ACP dehydrogenase [Kineosporia mesophila]